MNSSQQGARSGFSLVEVCLAILVVALGILAVFALFPFGLKASESAEGDTRTALFAESVLAMAHASASTITAWNVWASDAAFKAAVTNTPGFEPRVTFNGSGVNAEIAINFPARSEAWVRYKLDLVRLPGLERVRGILVQVCPGRYGAFTSEERFYTEVFFQGM